MEFSSPAPPGKRGGGGGGEAGAGGERRMTSCRSCQASLSLVKVGIFKLLNRATIRYQKAVSVCRLVEYFEPVEGGVSGCRVSRMRKVGFLCSYLRVSRYAASAASIYYLFGPNFVILCQKISISEL